MYLPKKVCYSIRKNIAAGHLANGLDRSLQFHSVFEFSLFSYALLLFKLFQNMRRLCAAEISSERQGEDNRSRSTNAASRVGCAANRDLIKLKKRVS